MKNLLVQYKGGCYDGCFWEWNFCYFDKNGKFHDIFSSGIYGINKKNSWDKDIKQYFIEKLKENRDDFYFFSTNSEKSLQNFVKEGNLDYIQNVANWFLKNEFDINMFFICPNCKQECNVADAISTSYKGDGGIGIIRLDFVCSDCYYTNQCEDCNEYDKNLVENNDHYYCNDCLQNHLSSDIPKDLINQVIFELTPGFDQVIEYLKSYISIDSLNDICTFDDLEKFAENQDLEFKPFDNHNNKLYGFFEPSYQFPNPLQISLDI